MLANDAVAGLSLVVFFELALPIIVYLLLRRRAGLHVRNALLGAGVFILFVVVLESLLHNFLLRVNPTSTGWLKAHSAIMAVYLALAAAIFEEGGRLLGLRLWARRDPGAATPLSYGLGHGGIECILVAVNTAVVLTIGLQIRNGHAADVHLPPEALAMIQTQLAGAHFFNSLTGALERASTLIVQVFLSFLVWRAIIDRRPLLWLTAFVLHFAVDLPAALLQTKAVTFPVLWLEGALAGVAILMVITLLRWRPAEVPLPLKLVTSG